MPKKQRQKLKDQTAQQKLDAARRREHDADISCGWVHLPVLQLRDKVLVVDNDKPPVAPWIWETARKKKKATKKASKRLCMICA